MGKKILLNIFYLGTGQVFSSILAIAYSAIVPAYLGPDRYGFITLMAAIIGITSVINNFGIKLFLTREIARDPEKGQTLVGPAIVINTLLSVITWSGVVIFFTLTNASSTFLLITYIVAISNVLSASSNPLGAALQGLDKMHFSLWAVFITKGLAVALVIVIVILNLGVVFVVGADLVSGLVWTLLILAVSLRNFKVTFPKGLQLYKFLLWGGISFLVVDITFNVYLYLDSVLLSIFTNDTVVGYYGVPTRLFGTLLTAPAIIAAAVLPTLSRLNGENGNKDEARNMASLTLEFFMCLSVPIAIGTTVVADPLIRDIFGSQFAPSIPAMILLAWCSIPTYLGMALFQILTAQNKQGRWSRIMFLAAVINLILNFLLIPAFQRSQGNGATGAALSLLLTEITIDSFGIRLVDREIISSRLFLSFLKSLGAAAVMGAVILPLQHVFILVPIAVGGIVYVTLIIFLFDLIPYIKKALANFRQTESKETASQGVKL